MVTIDEDDDLSDESEMVLRNCIFGFKCDKAWESLSKTNESHVRFCGKCQKEVHLCDDDESLVRSISLNRCIAIEPATFVGKFDGGQNVCMGDIVYGPKRDDS